MTEGLFVKGKVWVHVVDPAVNQNVPEDVRGYVFLESV